LREDLNVAERMQHRNILARYIKCGWLSLREQSLECELPARVPQIAADQPGSAVWANPQSRQASLGRGVLPVHLDPTVPGSHQPTVTRFAPTVSGTSK
jgi:hypothetical protein